MWERTTQLFNLSISRDNNVSLKSDLITSIQVRQFHMGLISNHIGSTPHGHKPYGAIMNYIHYEWQLY